MDKRETVLKLVAEIEEWADDNDIATSALDQIELAERIYNFIERVQGREWYRPSGLAEYGVDK
jgi:hypothetical protein